MSTSTFHFASSRPELLTYVIVATKDLILTPRNVHNVEWGLKQEKTLLATSTVSIKRQRGFFCTFAGCKYSRLLASNRNGGFPRKDNWRRHMKNRHGLSEDQIPILEGENGE